MTERLFLGKSYARKFRIFDVLKVFFPSWYRGEEFKTTRYVRTFLYSNSTAARVIEILKKYELFETRYERVVDQNDLYFLTVTKVNNSGKSLNSKRIFYCVYLNKVKAYGQINAYNEKLTW